MISGSAVSAAPVSGDSESSATLDVTLIETVSASSPTSRILVLDVEFVPTMAIASSISTGQLVNATLTGTVTAQGTFEAARVLSVVLVSTAGAAAEFASAAEIHAQFFGGLLAIAPAAESVPSFETWVFGVSGGGTTRYEGFNFNSYAKIGHRYYGCRSDGIYQLDGDSDGGQPIRSMVSFGKQNFGSSARKRITNAYVGVSGQGRLFLKVMAEGREYTYTARSYDERIQIQRFDTGKGLVANWLEFELYNADGEDFELASVEFAIVPMGGRI